MTQNVIDDTVSRDISLEEVKLKTKTLKNGKASGLDMVSAGVLKNTMNISCLFSLNFLKMYYILENFLRNGLFVFF